MTLVFDPNNPPARGSSEEEASDGYLLDGVSAKQQPVSISLQEDCIQFSTKDHHHVPWKFVDIDWDSSEFRDSPIRIKNNAIEDAWLIVNNRETMIQLRQVQSTWVKKNYWTRNTETKTILRATASTLTLLVVVWFLWPYAADALAPYVPTAFRAELGQAAYAAYVGHKRVCQSPEADKALVIIKDRLTKDQPTLSNVKIVVVDMSIANAFTLADNHVLLTSGLLYQAKSSEEIAGVLAHEFGHALHNHVTRITLSRLPIELTLSVLGTNMNLYSRFADTLIGSAYSRKFESEADATGLELLKNAHISSKGFEDFFRRSESHNDIMQTLQYFSSHPPSAERAERIAHFKVPDARPLLTPQQWLALQSVCSHSRAVNDIDNLGAVLKDRLNKKSEPPKDAEDQGAVREPSDP